MLKFVNLPTIDVDDVNRYERLLNRQLMVLLVVYKRGRATTQEITDDLGYGDTNTVRQMTYILYHDGFLDKLDRGVFVLGENGKLVIEKLKGYLCGLDGSSEDLQNSGSEG